MSEVDRNKKKKIGETCLEIIIAVFIRRILDLKKFLKLARNGSCTCIFFPIITYI